MFFYISKAAAKSSRKAIMLATMLLACFFFGAFFVACGGGAGASAGASPVVSGPGVALVLNANRFTGVAPLAVSFDAIGTTATTTNLPFHEIRYTWNFGDPAGGATWAYGTRPGVASKNVASGPVAAHVFETPDTYTVTLTGFDGVNNYTKTSTVTVTDPNLVFAANTIYVSQSGIPVAGGADGIPAGANVRQVTNWSTIATLAQTYKRIFLKRGDTWSVNGTAGFGVAQAGPGIIAAYGTGNKPKIAMDTDNNNALNFGVGANDWRLVDVEIASVASIYRNNADNINVTANNILILKCALSGGRILIGGSNAVGLYVVDSIVGPVSPLGYGICGYIDKTDNIAYLGNRVTGSKDHGTRLQGTSNSVVSNNQFDTPNVTAHVFTLRGKANDANVAIWNGLWSENNVISDNLFDGTAGSAAVLKVAPQADGHAERLRNIIVERNMLKGNNVYAITTSIAENGTFRNNISVTYGRNAVTVGSDPSLISPAPSSGFFYNNTFYKPDISLTNGSSVMEVSGTPTGLIFKNNIGYAPLDTRDGATNGSSSAFYNLHAGISSPTNYTGSNNSSNSQVKSNQPWAAITPVNAVDFTPTGYAVNSGVAVSIWDDFMGNLRLIAHSLGAINP